MFLCGLLQLITATFNDKNQIAITDFKKIRRL